MIGELSTNPLGFLFWLAALVIAITIHEFAHAWSAERLGDPTPRLMGRLTLNVLLSFAQFEREVTGERIRDKIAASKRKGMWMGGPLPLGYDVENRRLVVNEREAALVRRIFDDFATLRSATTMVRAYAAEGIRTKTGRAFCKQSLYKVLHNRMYLGEIVHKGKSYPGQHAPIVSQAQWAAAHAVLAESADQRRAETRGGSRGVALLRGLLYAPSGERMYPTYSRKNGRKYHYYVSKSESRFGAPGKSYERLPAPEIEAAVVAQMVRAMEPAAEAWCVCVCPQM